MYEKILENSDGISAKISQNLGTIWEKLKNSRWNYQKTMGTFEENFQVRILNKNLRKFRKSWRH